MGRLYAILGLTALFILCAVGAANKPAAKTRRMKCVVTAYCAIPRGSKWTAKQRAGTCAVDPRVIPYGSIVHVAGRHLTAMGRHGKNGAVVDIYMPTRKECMKFGRKTMTVRVEARR